MDKEKIRDGIAQELAKVPKGYIGITDPTWYAIRLAAARVQALAILEYLDSQGVGIKGECLGASHPHLAAYYTFESLI